MSEHFTPYGNWIVSSLRRECIKRKLKEYPKKRYVKREVLEAMLIIDDKSKRVIKRKGALISTRSPLLIIPKPFVEIHPPVIRTGTEESLSSEDKSTLIIGLGINDEVSLNCSRALFTGVRDHESLKWIDLTVKKTVPPNIFSSILIYRPSVLFNHGGILDPRKISTILSTLKKTGVIHVVNYTDPDTHSLNDYLEKRDYETSSTWTINIRNYDTVFNIFRKRIKVTPKPHGDVMKLENNFDDGFEEITVRPPGKYTIVNLTLNISKHNKTDKFKTPIQVTGITLEQFRAEIEKDQFIEAFVTSSKNLFTYKAMFYKRKLIETQKEFARVQTKVHTLRRKGVSYYTIKEMYPMCDFYAGFILVLEELVKTVLDRIEDVNPTNTRKNLIEALTHPTRGFASIVGRQNIKDNLASQLYAFSKSYKSFVNAFNNICLMGSTGVGKTILAKVIGFVFAKSGILATDTVKIISRADIVGQYVGQTAPRTRACLLNALEGVLFIDEAYQLTPEDPGRDFGPEAITEIVNFLDKYIGMNVVIVAGYEDLMKGRFFPSNEGLSRRFPFRLILEKYSVNELTDILIQFIERGTEINIDDETGNWLFSAITQLSEKFEVEGVFSNQAGDMLNLGASIIKSINSSYAVSWTPGNLKNNTPILLSGLNDYLLMKGLMMT